ncbi:MAG: undecaprenyldiphospho-muramoylpentapeptide beta-N-acetylglucosaminyltransferase [Rhodospirillaceae bacterium]|nr:undecaprenyldiphospho-muramoylpentapeptide beta-N-acetylglucosaminyltransferase [Rhodospirillaceae bacterium]MYB12147.1 undecaprenyldiphospho-muramoylpentapeptide beta-N-acetylglucosaminyltransferase [Rhodospirillaceae bacterium]MYI49930.1 undecaprenyldiphospho-muramoylpentapeptide beta-N-acetylglucosaminyltransferase [Rhodospirillaceae bacterium]
MSRPVNRTIVLTAGGTGGHLFPAVALGAALLQRGYAVRLYTDRRGADYARRTPGIEAHVVPAASPFRGGAVGKIAFLFVMARGALAVSRLLRRHNPAAVVGFGGYAAFPATFMAARQRRPVVLHEQNGYLGLANRKVAKAASAIAVSFPAVEAIPQTRARTVETGNPVRPEINALYGRPYAAPAPDGPFRLFVMGGSQGATVFSEVLPGAIAALEPAERARLRVTQQCRPEDIEPVRVVYRDAGVAADLASFFENIPEHLSAAHLMICRAGASTCAEALVAGVPAIYVPYPAAADDHQTHNARHIDRAGAGWLMPQTAFTPAALAERISRFLKDPEPLAAAARAATAIARPDAAERLADLVAGVAEGRPAA